MEQIITFLTGVVTALVPTLIYIRSRFSNDELKSIALEIHAARDEASDEGSEITNEEALDIIDDIIVAYVE